MLIRVVAKGLLFDAYKDWTDQMTEKAYDALNRLTITTWPDQNRLTTLTQGTNVTSYTYDLNGNNVLKTLPKGDVVTTEYDALNRKNIMTGTNPDNTNNVTLYRYKFAYDAASNLKEQKEFCSEWPFTVQPEVTTIKQFTYDDINRLTQESDSLAGTTTYSYDDAHNRIGKVYGNSSSNYTYNAANQLSGFSEGNRTVTFSYDNNGNRVARSEGNATDTFGWDYENRLVGLSKQSTGGIGTYAWAYDYRTRRVNLTTPTAALTQVVFSGGTSVREIENGVPTVDYVRGSDWGGGVGGILYTLRPNATGSPIASFTHYNGRGDVVAKTNAAGMITYQSSYEAFGKRWGEWGSTPDRQKSNTKDEDIPGYANEGFRFRDLETGAFLSKDPMGFVDGPNLYAYVNQNPWTSFDPEGLDAEKIGDNKYRYVLRPDLNPKQNPNVNIRGSFVTNAKSDRLSGNCAMGAQWTTGTVKKDGVHDAPSTSTWSRGDQVSKDTKPGTMVARSWIQDEKGNWVYPSMSIQQWKDKYGDKPINHVGTFESMTKNGDVKMQDQFKTSNGQLDSRTHSGKDGWYEVNGSAPYDAKPSDSAVMPHPVDPKVKPDPTKQPNPGPVPDASAKREHQQTQGAQNQQQPKPPEKKND